MSKYIIKNCENILYCTACKDYECALADEFPYKRKCADTDNCNLKQIVELCNDDLKPIREWQEGDTIFVEYKKDAHLANNILQLLDIQEVE